MALTYTEQFETKRAAVEMNLSDGKYSISYTVTGPIDGTPENVNADIFLESESGQVRVGYASYAKMSATVRFDSSRVTPVADQATISSQFFNDLQSILA